MTLDTFLDALPCEIDGYALRITRYYDSDEKAEMCEYWNLPCKLIKPLNKIWRGQDRKITAAELNRITGWQKRTNQEMRDAALIAWVYANKLK